MMIRPLYVLALTVASVSTLYAVPAAGQSSYTSSVETQPVFVDGELRGCTIVFDVRFNDTRFRGGEPTLAAGSVTLLEAEENLAVGLRLGLSKDAPGARVESPDTAFLVDGPRTSSGEHVSTFDSDVPGYRNFAFRLGDVTSMSIVAFMSGQGTVGFTRDGGSAAQLFDVVVPADEMASFNTCTGALLDGVRQR